MKKRGLLIALIFIIFSVFVTHAKAQEDTKAYEEAYKNYSLKLEEYEKALNRKININFYDLWKNIHEHLRNNILNGILLHGSIEL